MNKAVLSLSGLQSPREGPEVRMEEQRPSQVWDEACGIPRLDAERQTLASLVASGTVVLRSSFLRVRHELVSRKADADWEWATRQGEPTVWGYVGHVN